MAIAIFDYDLINNPGHYIINLEAMKLAAYYKSKNQIVNLLTDSRESHKYVKVFLRKDIVDNDFPYMLMAKENVKSGGLAFTDGRHVPLHKTIELKFPDYLFYNEAIEKLAPTVKKRNQRFLDYTLVRLAPTEERKINLDYNFHNPGSKNILIYDTNIQELEGLEEAIQELEKKYKRVCLKESIEANLIEELIYWSFRVSYLKPIKVNFEIDKYDYISLVQQTINSRFKGFTITKDFSEEFYFLEEIKQWTKRILYTKAQKAIIPIRFNFTINGKTNNIQTKLLKILEGYAYIYFTESSIYDFAIKSKEINKEIMDLLLVKRNSELYSLLKTKPQNLGGVLTL